VFMPRGVRGCRRSLQEGPEETDDGLPAVSMG
jgi:hypothetical protein